MKPANSHRSAMQVHPLRRILPMLLLACAAETSAAPPVPDLSGTWSYAESSLLVLKPEEATLHVTCLLTDGVLTVSQTGAEITGTLTHYSTECISKDGQALPPPWPLPYEATFTGRIHGHALTLDQVDAPPAPPVHCPKQGAIQVENGEVEGFRTTGRCELDIFPFPFMAKNFGHATRL